MQTALGAFLDHDARGADVPDDRRLPRNDPREQQQRQSRREAYRFRLVREEQAKGTDPVRIDEIVAERLASFDIAGGCNCHEDGDKWVAKMVVELGKVKSQAELERLGGEIARRTETMREAYRVAEARVSNG